MTKIPLKDYQNAKKLSTDDSPADDQDKDGFKLEKRRADVFKFRCRNALKIGCTIFCGFNLSS